MAGFDFTERQHSATGAVAVTPSDAATISPAPVCLYVGTQGNVAVEMADGTTATFVGAQGVLPAQVRRVLATGTTATDILALYN